MHQHGRRRTAPSGPIAHVRAHPAARADPALEAAGPSESAHPGAAGPAQRISPAESDHPASGPFTGPPPPPGLGASRRPSARRSPRAAMAAPPRPSCAGLGYRGPRSRAPDALGPWTRKAARLACWFSESTAPAHPSLCPGASESTAPAHPCGSRNPRCPRYTHSVKPDAPHAHTRGIASASRPTGDVGAVMAPVHVRR